MHRMVSRWGEKKEKKTGRKADKMDDSRQTRGQGRAVGQWEVQRVKRRKQTSKLRAGPSGGCWLVDDDRPVAATLRA